MTPQVLLPRRAPRFIDRVTRLLFKTDPTYGPQPQQQETTQSGVVAQAMESVYDQYFQSRNERLAIYKDVDEMDSVSEEASVALDILADNTCTSEDGTMESFEVYSEDEKVQGLLDEVCDNCDLYHKAYVFVRNAIKYGDMFLEIVANGEAKIVDVRNLPPHTMFRNQDAKGNFILGAPKYNADGTCANSPSECAFDQREVDTARVMAAFWPWQIVHGRWNWDGFSPYGRSYLRVARIIWKKLKAEEEALIMGRLVRAMLKLVFKVDTTGLSFPQKQAALTRFREEVVNRQQMDGKRENPFYVLTDFFLSAEHYAVKGQVKPSLTGIDMIDPKNEGLNEIADIEFFHRKYLACLRVPPAYMAFEKDVSGGSAVSMQDIEFIRFLRRMQQFMSQHLRQIFDTALTLQGFNLDEVKYEIRWPPLSTADEAAAAEAEYYRAQSMAIWLGGSSLNQKPVIDPLYVQKHILEMSDQEIEEVNQRLEEQHQDEMEEQNAEMLQRQAAMAANAQLRGPNESTPHGFESRSPAAKAKQGSNTAKKPPLRQEVNKTVEHLRSRIREQLAGDLERIHGDQLDALEEAQQLGALTQELFPRGRGNEGADSAGADGEISASAGGSVE